MTVSLLHPGRAQSLESKFKPESALCPRLTLSLYGVFGKEQCRKSLVHVGASRLWDTETVQVGEVPLSSPSQL